MGCGRGGIQYLFTKKLRVLGGEEVLIRRGEVLETEARIGEVALRV